MYTRMAANVIEILATLRTNNPYFCVAMLLNCAKRSTCINRCTPRTSSRSTEVMIASARLSRWTGLSTNGTLSAFIIVNMRLGINTSHLFHFHTKLGLITTPLTELAGFSTAVSTALLALKYRFSHFSTVRPNQLSAHPASAADTKMKGADFGQWR